uniref:Palmitoyl-protein thioesterase 1 n=1 Tax=viral metagenome TaxID=1070528 RepID=A0A6C0HP34_9ZZZZ
MSMILSFLFAFLFATTSSTCQNISSSTYTRISPPNDTSSVPVVVLHGILSSAAQTKNLSDWISTTFDRVVFNIEVGSGAMTSMFTPMTFQTKVLCETIYEIDELSDGFDFIGISQGGLLARAYVETCNKYPVRNLITLVSPHGGITQNETLPRIIHDMYAHDKQSYLSFSGYWRNSSDLDEYFKKCRFLPWLNNEVLTNMSKDYAFNMKMLVNFVLVWSDNDDVVYPKESAKFSFLDKDNNLVGIKDTDLYKNDDLGLRFLDETGSFHIHNVSCAHDKVKHSSCNNELYDILVNYL